MIDYKLLNDSVIHYESEGFQRIETPWTVSYNVDSITRPKNAVPFQLIHNSKCLVASGEQSFLYQYLKGFLPLGQYQTITPCFRYEAFDFLHSKTFMKNELIKTDVVNHGELLIVIDKALAFYTPLFGSKVYVKKDGDSYDIEVEGNELGSYGIRSCEFLNWIYGTGLAEPRTSNLIKLYGIS